MLSHRRLCELVESGVIRNLESLDQINGTSIDVRLGDTVMIEQPGPIIDFRKRDSPNFKREMIFTEPGLILYPNQFILGHTMEVFDLPLGITAIFTMKSSAGRVGLNHALAAFCDPGWTGSTLTLELKNDTQFTPIRLRPGDFVGQMYFFEHEEVPVEFSYLKRGRYNYDHSVTEIKL